MKKPILTVLIANMAMICTATAPVYSMSVEGINALGLAVILGSMAAMNLLAGGGLSAFNVAEGKYFLRLGMTFFVTSIAIFLIRLKF